MNSLFLKIFFCCLIIILCHGHAYCDAQSIWFWFLWLGNRTFVYCILFYCTSLDCDKSVNIHREFLLFWMLLSLQAVTPPCDRMACTRLPIRPPAVSHAPGVTNSHRSDRQIIYRYRLLLACLDVDVSKQPIGQHGPAHVEQLRH